MSSWKWWDSSLLWHERFLNSLAFIVWIEGPYFYSDLVRGIAVGLFVSALVVMTAKRSVLFSLVCALGVVLAFAMEPRLNPSAASVIATHVISAFILAGVVAAFLNERRPTRGGSTIAAH